jgi:hypothetical protein
MKIQAFSKIAMAFVAVLLMAGCATKKPGWDYSAYKASKPRSILVLPPVNNSPDITATYSVMSFVTKPLSEAGYYVMPVAMVAEAFKENGLTQPSDMHATSPEKLREIFGADAALYITVTKFGVSYTVVNSETMARVQGKLVDLKTGATLSTRANLCSPASRARAGPPTGARNPPGRNHLRRTFTPTPKQEGRT